MSTAQERDDIKKLYESSGKIDQANIDFYNQRHQELREKHAGKLVAIVDGEFAGELDYEGDPEEFKAFLRGLIEDYSTEAVRSAYITLVPDPNQKMLL